MILNLIHVNINCTDLTRSVAFYEKVGFKVVHVFSDEKTEKTLDADGDIEAGMARPGGGRTRGCVMSAGDDPRSATKIELLQYVDPPSRATEPRGTSDAGVSRIAIRTKNLLGFVEELKAEGIEFMMEPQEIDVVGANRFVLFRDPDGVILELVEF